MAKMCCKNCGYEKKLGKNDYPLDGKGECPECRGTWSSPHSDCHYSITCHTDDLAVLHCLRGLADFAEGGRLKKIAWGGTGKKEWERDDHCVTFHFSSPAFRDDFRQHANRLLGDGWCKKRVSDKDPATPAWRG